MSMTACIVGCAHTPFGRLDTEDVESLIVRVVADAMADAGIGPAEVDRIVLGHFNAGFSEQDFTSSLVLQADPGLRFTPAVRVENACATGTAAVHAGAEAVAAGLARYVLVVGVEKMTDSPGPRVGDNLLRASYRREEAATEGGFAGIFARIAEGYFARYGDQSLALAHIASKNHRNGVANPYAQLRRALDVEFCNTVSERNPIVAGPLRRTDCSLVSDGAAALVLTDSDTAAGHAHAVAFRAIAQINDLLPMSRRDMTRLEGAERAWGKALETAGLGLLDLDLVETHDCFTVAELMEYEAMGLAPTGQGARVALEGWAEKGGKLPVNPSGGLKAKGHPIGATGVSMHALSFLQLTGRAGEMQIADAGLAGVFNMGGAGVANYVSILERTR